MDAGLAAPRLDEHGFPAKEAFPNVHDIYNREAKTYDTAMVERWKTAMEGLLIFAGLFSAAVTAFIIEGYKSLKPDSGDLTVALLYRMSQQLALSANGTQISPSFLLPPPAEVPFSPPWTSVTANILWLISLGLSLACAVAATLVQQWARNYIHSIERRPSAERRARMRIYLYEGVERFGMTQVVDGVPALLHLALFSFLLGLIFFIEPINWPVTAIAITIFLSSVVAYLYATLLPLVAFDSPIQTPLTSVLWRPAVIQKLYWVCAHTLMVRAAVSFTSQRHFRPVKNVAATTWSVVDLFCRHIWSRILHFSAAILPSHDFLPLRRPRRDLSQYSESSLVQTINKHWQSIRVSWSCSRLGHSLDAVRSLVARDTTALASQERETRALRWLVGCLDEDREILLFIEAMPAFVEQALQTRNTFSSIFCDPQLRLYILLPDLIRRHWDNPRVREASITFLLRVADADWLHIFKTGLATPHDIWSHDGLLPQHRFSSIMQYSEPGIRVKINFFQSTVDYCWLSTGHPWLPVSNERPTDYNAWWPQVFNKLWQQLLDRLGIPVWVDADLPLYLQPTLSLTRAFLNVLADLTPHNLSDYYAYIILWEHLPASMTWFSEHSPPEQQHTYIAVVVTVTLALERTFESKTTPHLLSAMDALFNRLRDVTDEAVLKHLDQFLQSDLFLPDGPLSSVFTRLVEVHINKLDGSGQPVFGPQVMTRYRMHLLGHSSDYAAASMVIQSLDLRHANPQLQRIFLRSFEQVHNRIQFALLNRFQVAVDAETGIEEVVLFFELAIEVFYTLNDLDALQSALDMTDGFLAPHSYPYNRSALECRIYLQDQIRRRALLLSVENPAVLQVFPRPFPFILPPVPPSGSAQRALV